MDSSDYMYLSSALNSFNNSLANAANMQLAAQTSRADRNFSREMSNLAWERNLEAWRMQNEYNLPVNQYQRQLEGIRVNGLNPNLVYGGSSSVSGAGGSISPYKFDGYHSTAVPQSKLLDDPSQAILSTRLLQTQVAAQEANNRLLNARADNEEARNPGIAAKSNEAAYRWNYIKDNISESYDAAIRAQTATEYWTGQQSMYNAFTAKSKSTIQFYEAAMAEWLNTEKVPGMDITYRQYMDIYKSYLPSAQFQSLKAQVLNFASQIAYRKSQGELLDLKKEYQRYANKFAQFGWSIGSGMERLVLSGLMYLFGDSDAKEELKKMWDNMTEGQMNMPASYPGP